MAWSSESNTKHEAPHINERNVTIIARKSRQMGSIAIAAWKTNECIEWTERNDNNKTQQQQQQQPTFKLSVVYDSCTAFTHQLWSVPSIFRVTKFWYRQSVVQFFFFLLCINKTVWIVRLKCIVCKRVKLKWYSMVRMGHGFKDFAQEILVKSNVNDVWFAHIKIEKALH